MECDDSKHTKFSLAESILDGKVCSLTDEARYQIICHYKTNHPVLGLFSLARPCYSFQVIQIHFWKLLVARPQEMPSGPLPDLFKVQIQGNMRPSASSSLVRSQKARVSHFNGLHTWLPERECENAIFVVVYWVSKLGD